MKKKEREMDQLIILISKLGFLEIPLGLQSARAAGKIQWLEEELKLVKLCVFRARQRTLTLSKREGQHDDKSNSVQFSSFIYTLANIEWPVTGEHQKCT